MEEREMKLKDERRDQLMLVNGCMYTLCSFEGFKVYYLDENIIVMTWNSLRQDWNQEGIKIRNCDAFELLLWHAGWAQINVTLKTCSKPTRNNVILTDKEMTLTSKRYLITKICDQCE